MKLRNEMLMKVCVLHENSNEIGSTIPMNAYTREIKGEEYRKQNHASAEKETYTVKRGSIVIN